VYKIKNLELFNFEWEQAREPVKVEEEKGGK
jgi:hypothetical protein